MKTAKITIRVAPEVAEKFRCICRIENVSQSNKFTEWVAVDSWNAQAAIREFHGALLRVLKQGVANLRADY